MSGQVLRTILNERPGAAHQHPVLPAVMVRRAPLSSADIGRFALQNGVRYVQYDLRLFTLIYAHEARTGAKFAPSFAIRGKTCGPMGRRPTFCWGPSTRRAARIRAVGRILQIRLWELAARAQTCGSSQREHKPVGARGASTKIFESSKFLYPKYQLASEKYLIFHSIFTATPPQKIEKIGERGSNLVLK